MEYYGGCYLQLNNSIYISNKIYGKKIENITWFVSVQKSFPIPGNTYMWKMDAGISVIQTDTSITLNRFFILRSGQAGWLSHQWTHFF